MARPYSLDLRERLIALVKAGCSAREAGRRLKVCASTAINWAKRWRLTGSVAAKPMHGHPPLKLAPHKDLVLKLEQYWAERISRPLYLNLEPDLYNRLLREED